MKPFESFLGQKIEKYVGYRKSLGFSLHPMTSHIRSFDRYLAMRNPKPTVLQPSFFLELRADLKLESRSVNRILSTTRMFFQYLVRQGVYTANPVKDIPLLRENEIIPFIFSEKQVDFLLKAVLKQHPKKPKIFFKGSHRIHGDFTDCPVRHENIRALENESSSLLAKGKNALY